MKSNESMLCYSFNPTLTLPLTHVKDEVKSVVAVTTPLILVKNEVKYDRYTFTTLLNGFKGESKYAVD